MSTNQTENSLPLPGDKPKRRNYELLPRFYRTDFNKKFINSTLDQLTQPGSIKKVTGFIGRQNAKSSTADDVFVSAVDKSRKDYQLEPGLVVKDELGNVEFFKDYIDYINQLGVLGANVDNHERLNRQEFYSWNPRIDWDKFVDFQQYYWLPYGPAVIDVVGQQQEIESTYTVQVENTLNNKQYLFTPNGLTRNPLVTLYRGQTYHFEISSQGEPFSIKTSKTLGSIDRYDWGDNTVAAIESGTITFTVPTNAPDVLFYVSENDANLGGVFKILDITDNTFLDVSLDILGKKFYKLPSGVALSNGMKLRFRGNVTPSKYANDLFYVEGVGDKITLVAERDLEIISSFSSSITVPFDDTPFDQLPFDIASSFSASKDYVVINRASKDRNPWSRYNRWFHKTVIETSAALSGQVPSLDQASRAIRPIIEFEAGLKLFNFGYEAIFDVDLIDTVTTDVFSTIEGQLGYAVDGIKLVNNQRILFAADTDILVRSRIYRVEFIEVQPPNQNRRRQIRLVEESIPAVNQTTLVKYGTNNQGLMYWFNGNTWQLAQTKTAVNQAPLFDIVDENFLSYSDVSVYDGSTFTGTKLFSYATGSSVVDTELGFSLSYKNINNIGDILFNFNLLTDTFLYKNVAAVEVKSISVGSLIKATGLEDIQYVTGWETSTVTNIQPVVRIFKNFGIVPPKEFPIDVYDNISNLTDLSVRVYINGKRLDKSNWTIVDGFKYKTVVLSNNINSSDVVTVKTFSAQSKNNNGYYEVPVNLQNNPLNKNITQFTLGEVIDHVDSIIDNIDTFVGTYPGSSNLRDLGKISSYGTKFVQHSGPLPLSIYHITSKTNNVVKAVQQSRDDYGVFKRQVILAAAALDDTANIREFVDAILAEINKDKPKTSPYYFSDMVPYGAATTTEISVVDYRIKNYPLSNNFNLDALSSSAVLVYVNDTQILYGVDYTFDNPGFVTITYSALANNDTIKIVEYSNTDGSFVPATPTKLGLWPKFTPHKYLDTTLVTPQEVIQGHDGSIVLAYGDFRDDILLELEKRIFNNIKVNYDVTIFDVNNYIPRYGITNSYSLDEFNKVLAPNFYQWTNLIDRDFTKPLSFDRLNPFTFNYKDQTAPDGRLTPGYWRGIYRWLFDTDRPHICPWEMLGFSIKPSWWEEQYGPAPYTSDNLIMWQDLSEGVVREPNKPIIRLVKYLRPFLLDCLPVNESGELISPIESSTAIGTITTSSQGDFTFGDVSPVENAWRRSSYYPFSMLVTFMLTHPAAVIGLGYDRSRVKKNISNQIIYSETNLRFSLKDIIYPNVYSDTSRSLTAGLVNYIVDYTNYENLKSLTQYKYDLESLTVQLAYRVAGFTEKEKFDILLDSKTPTAIGGVFVPKENYSIFLNTSSPVKKLSYSGVIITRLSTGFQIKGYDNSNPYFYYYPWVKPGRSINIGGVSEPFANWIENQYYVVGKIIKYNNAYYRSTVSHTTTDVFEQKFYQKLAALPVIGGRDAFIRSLWDRKELISVAYGTKFRTVQEVVDFLLGYGEYLKDQGFVFDDFNNNLGAIANWETASKEFLFWTTQNWSSGEDKWNDWLPSQVIADGEIIKYNGDYYRSATGHTTTEIFDTRLYVKLDELSSIGSSVLAVSPAANGLIMNVPLCIPEDIRDAFNGYSFFKPDGQKLEPEFLNSYRQDNAIQYIPTNTTGIYGATFYLIQKEHVVLLDNTSLFNDTLYDQTTGYRQEKIKILSYISTDWYGGLDIPGFIYDDAVVKNWEPWTDYNLGDVVKFKEFYYSSESFQTGVEEFNSNNWIKLDSRPVSRMLPNWSYKAEQFTDFYSLDSDNFDSVQQKVAQHLIGYQKRQYLENIIKDDISEYKFYQGMIIEKGTQNVLNKLFDVLSADNMESLTFFEEWAIRVGQYGSSKAYEEIEFELNESLFKLNPQAFELVNTIPSNSLDLVIRQTPNDVYLKPLGYNNSPWPIKAKSSPYLRSPGYVRMEDVDLNVDTLDSLLTQDISALTEGAYIWCAFEGRDWNVYRLTRTSFKLSAIAYAKSTKTLTLTTDKLPEVSVGDIIGLLHVSGVQGFYKISSVNLSTITISQEFKDYPDPAPSPDEILTFKLVSQRVKTTIDDAEVVIPERIKNKELLWVDDNGNGKWTTYERNNVYSSSQFSNDVITDGLQFGNGLAVNSDSTIAAISNANNELRIYKRGGTEASWVAKQTFTPTDNIGTIPLASFGSTLEFSPDGTWLVIGTPLASAIKTKFVGTWNNSSTYSVGAIVLYQGIHYTALSAVPANNIPSTAITYWQIAPLVQANATGSASAYTNQGLITIYIKDVNNDYNFVTNVVSPLPTSSEKFGSAIKFTDNNTFFVSANTIAQGKIYQFDYKTVNGTVQWAMNYTSRAGTELTEKYGTDLAASADGNFLAVTAPGATAGLGKVYLYKLTSGAFTLLQTLTGTSSADLEQFGSSVSLTNDGSYLAVSSKLFDGTLLDQGKVSIFKLGISVYSAYQTIKRQYPEASELFGATVGFMNNDQTLVIYSKNGDAAQFSTFDEETTTFDGDTLKVYDQIIDTGRVDIYDKYSTKWIFAESLTTPAEKYSNFGSTVVVKNNHVYVAASTGIVTTNGIETRPGKVYNYKKSPNALSWTPLHVELDKVDLAKIKKVFLYNKKTNALITYLDTIDPIQGKIAGPAEQEIKFKTFYDPAIYTVGTDAVNVDDGLAWTNKNVGMLWWDLRSAKFIDAYNGDVVYRNTNWNTLYETASIDIYEWVESSLLPADWDKQADTTTGLTVGISGKTLYGNTVYSVKKRYDNISKSFKNLYYYWVKNKTIVPNVKDRSLSAKDISNLIADPKGQGYQYVAFTGNNSFSLVNISQDLNFSNVNLLVQYWTIDDYTINSHSQWQLISNDENSLLPRSIERKFVDSLVGKDENDKLVPDTSLPPKLRYGVETRPRQSMFVNRYEALKQYIERINSVLKEYIIVDERDITDLNLYEIEPSIITGTYDFIIDTDAELRFLGVSTFRPADISPVIVDGKITDVIINDSGLGYRNAPYLDILGSGQNAKIKTVTNSSGQVISVNIENSGEGYNLGSTSISVRSFSVLVRTDSQSLGKWAIYSYAPLTDTWSRVRTQSYDVRTFWEYIDWYASGYNQFTLVDFSVDATYQLLGLAVNVGQLVKVNNIGTGGWLLLEKYATVESVDYTQSYKVVGRQNGTIKFSNTLYKFANTNLGFDGPLYDGDSYDNTAVKELRIILETLRNKILIDNLKKDYLESFFVAIRYAFYEQNYIDWAFKTSFVRAQHNVGELKQKVTYNNDNLADFESYISEVKPFRTKVREFVSSYTTLDNSQSVVTDFDLQSIYYNNRLDVINTQIVDGKIASDSFETSVYPWKHWNDNIGYSLKSITLVDGGSGYLTAPVVRINGGYGVGATAKAYISNGKVNRIDLVTPGSGFLSAPEIILDGGLSITGTAGRAVGIISDGLIRTNLIKIKFDRVAGTYFITNLQETEQWSGDIEVNGARTQFNLKWSPTLKTTDAVVTINGIGALRGTYSLIPKKSVTRGYTSYFGTLKFEVAPPKGSVVKITYLKDFNYLSAIDRINWYYDPATNEFGKDPAQLMTGIDYGGVQVTGLGFSVPQGWGSLPWFSDGWDALDPTFTDYIITVEANKNVFDKDDWEKPSIDFSIVAGEKVTVYYKPVTHAVDIIIGNRYRIYNPGSTNWNAVAGTTGKTYKVDDVIIAVLVGTGTGTAIDINARHIRLDDPYFDEYDGVTVQPNGRKIAPPDAIMQTFEGDGITNTLTIPLTLTVSSGDNFIFRKLDSDGNIKPQEIDYDTALSGGNLAYTTATGISADDIIIDGDGLVTPTTSPATEEHVPGQIVDTVAIKVFTKPTDGSARISYNNFITDGISATYPIGETNSEEAIMILLSNSNSPLVINDDYTVDYVTREVTLNAVPVAGVTVSVINFSFSGNNLLEIDFFVGDGSTTEFVTTTTWFETGLNSIVYVNGQPQNYELFKTDNTYDIPNIIGIRFSVAPVDGAVISYLIVSSIEDTFSITKSESFIANGTDVTYDLTNRIGDTLPYDANMIVYSPDKIYSGSNNTYYTITENQLEYFVLPTRFLPFTISNTEINVLVKGALLNPGIDYTVDLSGISVKLKRRIYEANIGSSLVISIVRSAEYTCSGTTITFTDAPLVGTPITILSFYKHNVLDIERTAITASVNLELTQDTVEYFDYVGVFGKRLKLDRQVISDNYVWIIKNSRMLQYNLDYKLNDDRESIALATEPEIDDKFTLITFSSNIVIDAFGFMQFKDMLNRTHYKRLSRARQTKLATALIFNSTEIVVEDGSMFSEPNPSKNLPGIIEIFGERIEYYRKDGNTFSQLRRGTLGTGARSLYPVGTIVQDIGITETIPYQDETVIEQLTSNGLTSTYELTQINPIIPIKKFPTKQHNYDSVEIFAGGYNVLGDWTANTRYRVGDIVMLGSYRYKVLVNHVSGNTFESAVTTVTYDLDGNVLNTIASGVASSTVWQFFIGNIRLKKRPYTVHNVNIHSESPEGDVEFAADFVVNPSGTISLADQLTDGTQLTVIKKIGRFWEDLEGTSLASSNNLISKFVRNK